MTPWYRQEPKNYVLKRNASIHKSFAHILRFFCDLGSIRDDDEPLPS